MQCVLSNVSENLSLEELAALAKKYGACGVELLITENSHGQLTYDMTEKELQGIKKFFDDQKLPIHSLAIAVSGMCFESRTANDHDMDRNTTAMLRPKQAVLAANILGCSILRIISDKPDLYVLKGLCRYASYRAGGMGEGLSTVKLAHTFTLNNNVSDIINIKKATTSINSKQFGACLELSDYIKTNSFKHLVHEFNQCDFSLHAVTVDANIKKSALKTQLALLSQMYDGFYILPAGKENAAAIKNIIKLISTYSFDTDHYDYKKYSYPSSMASIIRDMGSTSVTPCTPVTAGESGTWEYRFTAKQPIAKNGGIRVRFHHSSNWSVQVDHPSAPNYVHIKTDSAAKLKVRCFFSEDACMTLEAVLEKGVIKVGENIIMVFGETKFGSCGTNAQTYEQKKLTFFTSVDVSGYGNYFEQKNPPCFDIIGGEAVKIDATAPSVVRPFEAFDVKIRIEDKFVNQAANFKGTCLVKMNGCVLEAQCHFTGDAAIGSIKNIIVKREGMHKIEVFEKENQVKPYSFYIKCDQSAPRLIFGDIHGHSGLMDATGTASEYYTYARDVAFLDFCSLSEHIDSFSDGRQSSNDHQWQEICTATKQFNNAGEFSTILSYENSAKSDINLYFYGESTPWYADGYPPALMDYAKKQKALVIPHMTTYAQFLRGYDWAHFDAAVVPVIEIYSNHGASERFGGEKPLMDCEPGGYAIDALNRGHKIGFIASGDGHDGMPGNALWHKYINGLAAVFVAENQREQILDAIKARNCYATTNERIIGEFFINGSPMGSEICISSTSELRIKSAFYGTDEISYADIVVNGQLLERSMGDGKDFINIETSLSLTTNMSFGHNYIYIRMKQKDNNMAWLSPIFIKVH